MSVHSFPQLSFGFPYIYQPTKSAFDCVHYVIGFTRQILETMCGKWTFGEITWKRIVGNENITCLTILGPAFRNRLIFCPLLRVALVVACAHSIIQYTTNSWPFSWFDSLPNLNPFLELTCISCALYACAQRDYVVVRWYIVDLPSCKTFLRLYVSVRVYSIHLSIFAARW